jgi:phosphatidylinositol-3-phosphatase
VIGNPSMPYLNSLANKYGLATQYFANTHPSIGNYFMLTTGQVVTNNDSFAGVINVDDVVDHLLSSGKTWKSYAESLPFAGYTGGDAYPYVKRHNPFSYFSEVVNSNEKLNLVPFTQFATDLANNQLPNFSFMVPNVVDDAHDGTLAQADAWLSTNIAPLLASAMFQQDGVLILVFDESNTSDTQGGGGHVAALVIGPHVKSGYQSRATYQHPSTLKSLLEALGVTSFPGAAQTASDMGEFFVPPPPPPPPPPSPDFSDSISPASATVQPGQSADFSVALSPANGFKASVSFDCAGLPTGATCKFSPASVNLSQPMNVALSITTTELARAQLQSLKSILGLWLPLLGIAVMGAGAHRRKRSAVCGLALFLLALGLIQLGCGGSHSNSGSANPGSSVQGTQVSTPAGSYSVKVVASSGSISHTTTVQLVVK